MSNNFLSTCTGTACFDNNPAVGALSSGSDSGIFSISVQVILCQKHSFLHQLTQNMMTDCLLNYNFSSRKLKLFSMLKQTQFHELNKGTIQCTVGVRLLRPRSYFDFTKIQCSAAAAARCVMVFLPSLNSRRFSAAPLLKL